MRITRPAFVLALLLGFATLPATSRADLLVNGDFELGTNPPANGGGGVGVPDGTVTALTGWSVFGGTGTSGLIWLPASNIYGLTPSSGNYFVDLTGYSDQSPYYGVSQSVATVVGQTYTLGFDLGVDQGSGAFGGPVGVSVQAGGVTQSFSDNPVGTGNIWTHHTVSFVASSATSTVSIQGTQGIEYIGLDNVSLNGASAVPEPSGLILAGAAVAAVAAYRRRVSRKRRGAVASA